MELKQLEFFKLAAELEHITKAAGQLMVAQPYLSRTIKLLEEELGVELFDHVGRQIQLNGYGRIFYNRVSAMFTELEDARRELTDLAMKNETSIRLVTNASLYMAGLLSKYRSLEPAVNLHQASARRFTMVSQLRAGEVDFAICAPAITGDPELETITLIEDECSIIYPPSHWLKWHSGITLQELENESFISAAPGYGIRDLAEIFFETAGIKPPIIVESTDTSIIPQYVKNGLGIGFSPVSNVMGDPMLRKSHILVTDPPCIGVVGLTWKRNRYLGKAARIFKNIAIEYFLELRDLIN